MTDLYEEMLSQIQKKREIRIGSMPVLAPYHFARIMADFHEKHPDIQLIVDEMERQRTLGNISPETPFLVAYKQIGDALVANKQKAAPQPVAVKAKTVKTSTVKNSEKAKAAAPNRTTPSAPKRFINPLAMSDEEFLKQMKDRL